MHSDTYISHLYSDSEWHIQTNSDHCQGVADLASTFASSFGMASWGRMLGLLHDKGKECEGFQAHIKKSSGFDPKAYSSEPSNHSLAGAVIAHSIPEMDDLYWLSNCIAGHHRGLYNIDELSLKIKEGLKASKHIEIPDVKLSLPSLNLKPEDSSHLTRMLFSCLVDADWLDTELFMDRSKAEKRGGYATISELKESLDKYLHKLHLDSKGELNDLRTKLQNKCREASALSPGFYSLTIPTGGGKTLASIIWGLNHALLNNKKRIIIAIPFTSIIVQTASVLKTIFGEENVIEHHSALNEDNVDDRSLLACENWDAPIIVTTNVQLFESMFSNRPAVCRKLHSICESVVILDEVQCLPLSHFQPILSALKSYRRLFNTSFLFSTATLPIMKGRHAGCSGSVFEGIEDEDITEIIPVKLQLYEKFRRVNIEFLNNSFSYSELAGEFSHFPRMLCVVNTRKHALELYDSLTPIDGVEDFHLSRYMCGAHLLEVLNKVKAILKKEEKGVRVIATQLIEAGVDIDFPVVFRQICGLDSILQAAGRCNREGRETRGHTYIFELDKERSKGIIGLSSNTMKDLLNIKSDIDCFDPESIEFYYNKLYQRIPDFDKNKVDELQKNPFSCQFETISEKFKLIEESGKNIIVNFGDSEQLIEKLKKFGPSRNLTRELGRYSVNVPIHLFKKLDEGGLIEQPYKGFFYIPYKDQYDEKTGLKVNNDFLEQNFII